MLISKKFSDDDCENLISALKSDFEQAKLSLPDLQMLLYVKKLTLSPALITADDVYALRQQGFDDHAIHDICAIAAYYAFVNRIADGLGVELEDG